MDAKAVEAVQACQPYPAFSEKPEHDIMAIITFGLAEAPPQPASTANQPTPPAPSPDQVPALPKHPNFPVLPDKK
jgi:hypothetical protein